ncbi:MAG: DUF134 domain-containing protein [Bacteroidales bacterium]|nr:DUF134 domain-containing protein [Bacteroidales bacterium]
MPNRKKYRKIALPPSMEGYSPFGIPAGKFGEVTLLFEEFEAIRLTDYEDLTQEQAAKKMNISRPTFTRLYEKARKTIAKAFVEGKSITIQGGDYISDDFWYRCKDCYETMVTIKPADHCRSCDSSNILHLNRELK